jgi:hypothetical protein
MAYFPQFSNLKPHVRTKLDARKDNSIGVSQLNAWVRLTSGVGDGLVMTSNPDYQLFRAAGASTSIYDGAGGNATIGVDWNGRGISAGGGNLLRPKPVVTSVEVDEGAGSISRKATISITAFTKEQMETVCEYFLEPGYTVFLEFGWNTPDSVKELVTINETNVAAMQDFGKVNEKRVNSKGDYENYLGYITGGGVSFDDGKWVISVNLTGFTELPFYLQTHKGAEKEGDKSETKAFSPSNVAFETNPGVKRFKTMFNDLPSERQTEAVKALVKDTTVTDLRNYINFDDKIKDAINSLTRGTVLPVVGTAINDEEVVTAAGKLEFPAGSEIVGSERFIRMETFMKILTAASVGGFKIGNNVVDVNFDISNTVIGAFPAIYSLDKSKLFIPNQSTPNFSIKSAVESGGQSLDVSGLNNTNNNSIAGIQFPKTEGINQDAIEKSAYNWGYLKDLYVNFDFVKSVIGTKNFAIKDVLYNILNGLSSAVNSYWQFEIQEAPDGDDVMNLQIVDLNFVSKTVENEYEFSLSGNDSIFIESSFDMDLGGALMNQIIGKRLSTSTQPEKQNPGLFSLKSDKILKEVQLIRNSSVETDTKTPTSGSEDLEQIKKERITDFLGKTGIYPRVTLIDTGQIKIDANLEDVNRDGLKTIEDLLYIATYNDSNLFNEYKTVADGFRSASTGEYSPILPIKFSFTIHGISGIQRGDKFKVKGIPKTFDRGFFQVTSVKHALDGMMWKTSVEGSFRNKL